MSKKLFKLLPSIFLIIYSDMQTVKYCVEIHSCFAIFIYSIYYKTLIFFCDIRNGKIIKTNNIQK